LQNNHIFFAKNFFKKNIFLVYPFFETFTKKFFVKKIEKMRKELNYNLAGSMYE